ncbi:MAG: ABC transporter permease [Christensenellales bacterium]
MEFLKCNFWANCNIEQRQYRAFLLNFFGELCIFLYSAFMKNGVVNGFSLSQMATYVWLGQAFFVMKYVSIGKNVAEEITSGNVCYKFVRPIKVYDLWYCEHVGEKLASTLLRFLPILLVGFLLPQGFNMSIPVSFVAFLLFLLSLSVGLLLNVALSMFAVNLIFKTLSSKGSLGIVSTICGLLGGMYIPLPLLPQGLQNVLNYLPFRFVSDLPFRIYIGNVPTNEALIYIAISLAWLFVLVLFGKLLMKRALKKTVIQGG